MISQFFRERQVCLVSKARVMREILFHNLYLYRPVIKPSDRFLWVIETSWTRSFPVCMEPAQILISSLGDGAIVPVLLLTSFLAHCSQYWAHSCIPWNETFCGLCIQYSVVCNLIWRGGGNWKKFTSPLVLSRYWISPSESYQGQHIKYWHQFYNASDTILVQLATWNVMITKFFLG